METSFKIKNRFGLPHCPRVWALGISESWAKAPSQGDGEYLFQFYWTPPHPTLPLPPLRTSVYMPWISPAEIPATNTDFKASCYTKFLSTWEACSVVLVINDNSNDAMKVGFLMALVSWKAWGVGEDGSDLEISEAKKWWFFLFLLILLPQMSDVIAAPTLTWPKMKHIFYSTGLFSFLPSMRLAAVVMLFLSRIYWSSRQSLMGGV